MNAYAVRMSGCYWRVYAPTSAIAKGMVIALYGFLPSIACRRWPALDGTFDRLEVFEWGYPGERDYETGIRIETPEPFQTETQR